MALSDTAVRKAKPEAKPYRMSDERGLYLLVQPDGAKWWRLDFTLAEKRRTMSLGVYPDVELGDARTKRDDARKLIAAGVDPVKERKGKASEDATSFKSVATRWLTSNRGHCYEHNYNVLERRLDRLIFPDIGHRDIRTLEATDLLKVIRKIEAAGSGELPRRMNAICGTIFRFAVAEGLKVRDPSGDIRGALKKKPPVKHHAFIRAEKMGAFLDKLTTDIDDEPDTVDAMLLTILTVGRTSEIRFAEKGEFEALGTDSALWRIPAARMKKHREHLVPLSRQADELVRRRLASMRKGDSLLFERRTRSGVISENTMLFAMYRLGYRSRATVHGFRSTFSTHANEATKVVDGEEVPMWHPDWVERCLAHVPDDQVRAAYNAAEYLPQRRRLLQWWANYLDEQLELARIIG
jgi:integrase